MRSKSILTLLCFTLFYLVLVLVEHGGNRQSAVKQQPLQPAVSKKTACQEPKPLQAKTVPEKTPKEDRPAVVLKAAIRKGETFSQAFSRLRVSQAFAQDVVAGFAPVIDFKRCMPGDLLKVELDSKGNVIQYKYERTPFEVYSLRPSGDSAEKKFKVSKLPVELERHVVLVSGMIDSSLFSAFSKAGLNSRLTLAFADIFSSQIDFNTESMPGDHFDIVFEKYFKDGNFIGYGRILAARYRGIYTEKEAYFFSKGEGDKGSYYDSHGQALGTYFLRSPLPVYRITSRFSKSRFHPILKKYRPHYGVDLAAPIGTPVMAVADGKVIFAGWKRGFGRTVIIKHHGGYMTYYGHLSRFGKGIKRGVKVTQRQIIGRVGKSGLATGPHLDYRIKKNGVFKNPFSMRFKPKSRLKGELLYTFDKWRTRWAKYLDGQEKNRKLFVDTKIVTGPPEGWIG